jgi:MoxR-like ATPase
MFGSIPINHRSIKEKSVTSKKKDQLTNAFWDKLGIPTCTLNEAKDVIELAFATGHVVCLVGEAGIGKTQLTRQIAKEKDWHYHAFFAAHVEREDLTGIPYPDANGDAYKFLVEKNIWNIINNCKPTLLVFDEWNRGDKAVMNAIFTVMEDRRFGSQMLPEHIHILACMNPSEGAYLVNEAEKDPAFRRRLCFIAVQTNETLWLQYATGPGKFHVAVTDFVKNKPHLLNDTQTREAGKMYANPASWEKVSDTCYAVEKLGKEITDEKLRRLLHLKISGHVGIGSATEFMAFIENAFTHVAPKKVLYSYPSVREIIKTWTKDADNSKLLELCGGVALVLISEVPRDENDTAAHTAWIKSVRNNLSMFVSDLPVEMLRALFSKIGTRHEEAASSGGFKTAWNKLSAAMAENEDWVKATTRADEALSMVEKDIAADKRDEKEKEIS